MRLYFQKFGAGFPLIILHGLLGSADNWQTIARTLGEHFLIFTPDLRNHGRSPHADEFGYEVMGYDLFEFMTTHQISRCHLLGHSMGGKVAMHFALRFPERVERLLIVDIAPRAYPPLHDEIFNALLPLDLNRFKTRDEISQALAASIPDAAVRQFLLKNVGRDDTGALRWKMNLRAIHRNYPKLNEALPKGSQFTGPALFIRGSKSDYVSDADCADLKHIFPMADICTIENARHWVHADAPEALLDSTRRFLR